MRWIGTDKDNERTNCFENRATVLTRAGWSQERLPQNGVFGNNGELAENPTLRKLR